MTTVRAKMRCNGIFPQDHSDHVKVHFGVVYSSDPESENKVFTEYTPCGELWMMIQASKPAATAFEPGKEYYVDITPAE